MMIRAIFAEFFGTVLLVYAAAATGQNTLIGALGSGLVVAALIASLGRISGCHLNPAVSLGFLVAGQPSYRKAAVLALVYIPLQMLGGIIGSLLCYISTQSHWYTSGINGGRHVLNYGNIDGGDWWLIGLQGVLIEMLISLQLMFVILMSDEHVIQPLYIGLAVTVGVLIGGDTTGGSMNPARSFGPELTAWMCGVEIPPPFAFHYVYWCGPIIGMVMAAIIYKSVFGATQQRWKWCQEAICQRRPRVASAKPTALNSNHLSTITDTGFISSY